MNNTPAAAAVAATHPSLQERAESLAAEIRLPCLPANTAPPHCNEYAVLLMVGEQSLWLQQTGKPAPGPVSVDFGSGGMRHRRRGGQNELLGKAVGAAKLPGLQVLDTTGGLGRDAFVLADLGCRVTLCERNPVIAALLASGIQRGAATGDAWLFDTVSRMHLEASDARQLPHALLARQQVIYLDPMFPGRQKSSAVKKEMAVFQALLGEGAGDDGDQLLLWALQQPVARVVVKRPAKAPVLAGSKPSHEINGKSVRFDVYVLGSLTPAE
jgi:16S rRNA (guanine1516-N2)-methyltransferase